MKCWYLNYIISDAFTCLYLYSRNSTGMSGKVGVVCDTKSISFSLQTSLLSAILEVYTAINLLQAYIANIWYYYPSVQCYYPPYNIPILHYYPSMFIINICRQIVALPSFKMADFRRPLTLQIISLLPKTGPSHWRENDWSNCNRKLNITSAVSATDWIRCSLGCILLQYCIIYFIYYILDYIFFSICLLFN